MAGAATSVGFGMAASAANAEASKYIGERMGPIAGQITNTLANLAQVAGPLGIAAGMFLSGIMGAMASGFSSPVYAEHRDEAIKSIQELLPVITQALPHIRTEEDFNELQHAVNSLATRWSLNSGGITGGYESGGDIGSKFNPLFTQALPLLEQRGAAGPGDESFDQWFRNYAKNNYASSAQYVAPGGGSESVPLSDIGTIQGNGLGQSLAAVLGIPQSELDDAVRERQPGLMDLISPDVAVRTKALNARYPTGPEMPNIL